MSLFLPVIDAFNKKKVDYVIVGGLAVVLHGYSRMTMDVDMVIGLDDTNALKAVEILTKLGFKPRVPVNPKSFADAKQREQWIKEKGLTVFSFYNKDNAMVGVDIFVDYPMEFKGMLARSIVKKLGKIPVRIASIPDLIKLKKEAGRAKDIDDIEMLKKVIKFEKS